MKWQKDMREARGGEEGVNAVNTVPKYEIPPKQK